MLNTSEMVSQQERNVIIETFITKMRVSGYRQDQIKRIVEAGLKGYQNKLEKARKSGQEIHRSSKSTEKQRFVKKLLDKNNWFRKKRSRLESDEDEAGIKNYDGPKQKAKFVRKVEGKKNENSNPITVLFVPKTPGGELARRLKEAEAEIEKITGDRVKVVEKAGVMLKNLLHKANPWAGDQCGRQDCLVCRQEKGGNCRQRNVTYSTECKKCQEKGGKKSKYYGESARTTYERGLEHKRDYQNAKEDSHMAKHWLEDHPGEERPEFAMKLARAHTSALLRQIHEAVLIEMANENNEINVLNSRGEYNRCQLPRLSIMMGTKTINDEETTPEELARAEEELTRTEEDIFLDANEDKKRKTAREDAQPASKRKKTSYNKKPAKKEPVKRPACDENGANENRNKKARIEGDDQSQTKTALEGTTASINKKNRKLYLSSKIPSFFNFDSNSKKSVQKLENPFPVHIENL